MGTKCPIPLPTISLWPRARTQFPNIRLICRLPTKAPEDRMRGDGHDSPAPRSQRGVILVPAPSPGVPSLLALTCRRYPWSPAPTPGASPLPALTFRRCCRRTCSIPDPVAMRSPPRHFSSRSLRRWGGRRGSGETMAGTEGWAPTCCRGALGT